MDWYSLTYAYNQKEYVYNEQLILRMETLVPDSSLKKKLIFNSHSSKFSLQQCWGTF